MSRCCMCGVDLDDYREGIWTYEDGQRAHRLCHELPHTKPHERRERVSAAPGEPVARETTPPSAELEQTARRSQR